MCPARAWPPVEQATFPATCGWCGALINDRSELYGLVRDSSMTHASYPSMDGHRLITACSGKHLGALRARYAARPFVEEEQWAGKIVRALRAIEQRGAARRPVEPVWLQEAAGLDLECIRRAITWLGLQARARNK